LRTLCIDYKVRLYSYDVAYVPLMPLGNSISILGMHISLSEFLIYGAPLLAGEIISFIHAVTEVSR